MGCQLWGLREVIMQATTSLFYLFQYMNKDTAHDQMVLKPLTLMNTMLTLNIQGDHKLTMQNFTWWPSVLLQNFNLVDFNFLILDTCHCSTRQKSTWPWTIWLLNPRPVQSVHAENPRFTCTKIKAKAGTLMFWVHIFTEEVTMDLHPNGHDLAPPCMCH